jgi:hypothetical protein
MLRISSLSPNDLKTYFICLHRGGDKRSMPLPLKENGGSSSMDDEERSAVGRSLMTNACPPAKVISSTIV